MTNKPDNVGAGQLALPLALADHARFANFLAGPNSDAVTSLQDMSSEYGNALWLWGPSGVGKSHLLQAVCAANDNSVFLAAARLREFGPEVLTGFDRAAVVCIDDVDQLLGERNWETALFRLYNALADQGRVTVVASRDNPQNVDFALPDLRSRLRSGRVRHLLPLSDDDCLAALKLRAALRGVELPLATGRYLLTHSRRDMGSLCRLLDELDSASLAAHRRLTIPFVKAIIAR